MDMMYSMGFLTGDMAKSTDMTWVHKQAGHIVWIHSRWKWVFTFEKGQAQYDSVTKTLQGMRYEVYWGTFKM